MPVASETPVPGGKKKVTFQISPKMSSYLLFFATGNFERLAAKSDSGAEFGIVSPRGSGEQERFALDSLGPLLGYRSEEHKFELQSLMRNSYAVFFLKKNN